ncbi:MAG: nuclear transport factor 2 family protein [Candidatus Ancaeobacter aquaticus]|nr:nuclear transport factor 2 family protein [Candidatus Ancaeobacter aquaticus]
MKTDPQTEIEIIGILRQFAEAYSDRDIDWLMSFFAEDQDVVFIGPGVDEKCIGQDEIEEQLTREWAETENAHFEIGWIMVSGCDNVAWVAADIVGSATIGKEQVLVNGRLTAVLEKRVDKWFWTQGHFSLPVTAE